MNDDIKQYELLKMGRELSEHLDRQTDPRGNDALLAARRRALRSITEREDRIRPHTGWLPAAAVASIAAISVAFVIHFQNDAAPEEHDALLASNFIESEGPWQENPEMLQDMDFTLWLDMTDSEDAG